MVNEKKSLDLSHLFHYLIIPHTFRKSPTFFQSVQADLPLFSSPRINTEMVKDVYYSKGLSYELALEMGLIGIVYV